MDCGNIFQIRHGSAKEESVSTHFRTHFNEKSIKLSENDDPKSTSFMMKSIFCAYTSRLRLVNPEKYFMIHQSHPTNISTKYGFIIKLVDFGSSFSNKFNVFFTTHFNEKRIRFV